MGGKKRQDETRDERRETRDERRETRDERREATAKPATSNKSDDEVSLFSDWTNEHEAKVPQSRCRGAEEGQRKQL